ncbi:MAG: XylR family transcriptional regulator [Planctomycetaceae bacterium]|nr:XylR family transcriptional regulator [Planctomycetaceae bacterium]
MLTKHTRRVALLVDTSTAWGRRLVHGVLTYTQMHGPWDLWLEPRGQGESLRLPKGWCGDGIIARVSTLAMAKELQQQAVPIVNVSGIRIPGIDFPRVFTDNDGFASLAVSHFVDRGIRNVAYIGIPSRAYSLDRQEAVARACTAADCNFEVYRPCRAANTSGAWERDRVSIGIWLKALPKPIGILAWGVRRGSDVIEEAVHHGILIPEEVAVLGDDDELLCEAVQPPMSGVIVACEQIGLQAGEMLENLMSGKRLARNEVALSPTGIAARASTDVLAVEDTDVAAAIRLIRNHASNPLTVKNVADSLAISRRSLERRFQDVLRRTIGEEITRVRLERAKLLLATTDMPVPAVAQASGYGSPEYLATIIKRDTGLTPRQYRKQARGR